MLSVSLEAWSFKYSQVENKLSNIQDQTKNTWANCVGEMHSPSVGDPSPPPCLSTMIDSTSL